MKKSFIKKVSALFTTLLLCFCNSSIQVDESVPSGTIYHRSNVKRSNNPFDDTNNNDTIDLRDIRFEYYETGQGDNMVNMQYVFDYSVSARYISQYDYDDINFYINCDNNYNLSFNISTNNYSNSTFKVKSLIIPFSSSFDNFSNCRIYIDFDFLTSVNFVSFGSFDSSISMDSNLRNCLSSYGYNFFNKYVDIGGSGYPSGNVTNNYSNENYLYLYIVFANTQSFSVPSGNNNLTFSLGKLHIYCDTFPHNSVYTNEPDNIYQNGFDVGYEKGLEKGESVGAQNVIDNSYSGKTYQEIYNIGYNTGYSQGHKADNYVPQLFEGIINIPISVLNGLVPLTFFDLSVIRVIITILSMSVIIWLISYIMSTKG